MPSANGRMVTRSTYLIHATSVMYSAPSTLTPPSNAWQKPPGAGTGFIFGNNCTKPSPVEKQSEQENGFI